MKHLSRAGAGPDLPDPPDDCPLCGLDVSDCECPVCPVCPACNERGCLTHLPDAEVLARLRMAERAVRVMSRELEMRVCGAKTDADLPMLASLRGLFRDQPPAGIIPEGVGGIDLGAEE